MGERERERSQDVYIQTQAQLRTKLILLPVDFPNIHYIIMVNNRKYRDISF